MNLTDGVVTLRPWREEELEEVARLTRNADVQRWTRIPEDNDADKVRAALAAQPEAEMILGIVDAAGGEILGGTGLHRASRIRGRRADFAMYARTASRE